MFLKKKLFLHIGAFLICFSFIRSNALENYLECKMEVEQVSKESFLRSKVNASTILQGLANAFISIGQIAGAEDDSEKQEGAFNLIGTVFNTIAQVSQELQQKEKKKSIDKVAEDLMIIFDIIDFYDFATLKKGEISGLIVNSDDRAAVLRDIILSEDKQKILIKELSHFLVDFIIDNC